MAGAKLSEAMLERIRRHRLLEADRQQTAAALAFGSFIESPEAAPTGEALAPASSPMTGLGMSVPRRAGDDPSPELLPRPCTPAALDAAAEALGFTLPTVIQQLYLEVGNGGFGPCNSFFDLDRMVAEYRDLTEEPAGPEDELWPSALLPIADLCPGFTCLDLDSGAVVDWDPEDLGDGEGDGAWQASFAEAAPDLIKWLSLWLEEPL